MRTLRMLATALVILLLASGCDPEQPAVQPIARPLAPASAWFDAPLDGSTLPLGVESEVVYHIASSAGVDQGELSINGEVVKLQFVEGAPVLATLRLPWTPPAPGVYTFEARGRAIGSVWSEFDRAVVTVLADTPTPTPTPTQEPTLTVTPTFTTTPTPTRTPTPTSAGPMSFVREVSTLQFYYGTCEPNKITVTIQVSDSVNVTSLVLFQKLDGQSWDEGTTMVSLGRGLYTLTLSGSSVPNHAGVETSYWHHQAVATNRDNQIIGRSPSYVDVTLNNCTVPLIPMLPPQFQLMPTAVPTFPIIK